MIIDFEKPKVCVYPAGEREGYILEKKSVKRFDSSFSACFNTYKDCTFFIEFFTAKTYEKIVEINFWIKRVILIYRNQSSNVWSISWFSLETKTFYQFILRIFLLPPWVWYRRQMVLNSTVALKYVLHSFLLFFDSSVYYFYFLPFTYTRDRRTDQIKIEYVLTSALP